MRTDNWCFPDSFWENRVASTWGEKFKDWQMSFQSRVSFKQQGIRKGKSRVSSICSWKFKLLFFISSLILKHNYLFLNENSGFRKYWELRKMKNISVLKKNVEYFDVQSYGKIWNFDFFDFNWLEATNGERWLAKIRKPLVEWDRKKS